MSQATRVNPNDDLAGIAPNAMRLLIAGFLAILAAGVGFAVRGAIFENWKADFHFSDLEVGSINGAGFTGFCFGIIIGGIIVDKIGYGKLVAAAFLFHVTSAVICFVAAPGNAFIVLWISAFLFAIANGTLEAVANPLVATLFPKNRTHYLNILHASWPAGLVLGSLVSSQLSKFHVDWRIQLVCFIVPAVLYGLLFLGQSFPKSEAAAKGLSLSEMFRDVGILGSAVVGFFGFLFFKDGLGKLLHDMTGSGFFGFTQDVGGASPTWQYISIGIGVAIFLWFAGTARWSLGAPLLFVLFITHALVGAVELGTDSWIQNIENTILFPGAGQYLFAYTSALMFALRFSGHFIEHTLGLKPPSILFTCACLACLGLNLVAGVTTFGSAMGALTVYALGKTFFWPTMLAVASDRFPRCGAVAISIMGGLGMMSAGLIGSQGLGYAKDRFSGEQVAQSHPDLLVGKDKESQWLVFEPVRGLDAGKLEKAKTALEELNKQNPNPAENKEKLEADQKLILDADVEGSRKTLRVDSVIPATMAVIYLCMIFYFMSIGGYKAVHVGEEITGGLNAPMEA